MTALIDIRDRSLAAFYGLALGDALGMPTQSLSREQIKQRFNRITTLTAADADQPIAPNMAAGSITDDTEQAVLVGELLVEGAGRIVPSDLAQSLIEWEAVMQAKGSQDLLGPSTKRAIEMILAGHSPEEAGRFGTTNGAAMRIAPIGIAFDVAEEAAFVESVKQACQVTHNTNLGISSAAAVAAVVSAGAAVLRADVVVGRGAGSRSAGGADFSGGTAAGGGGSVGGAAAEGGAAGSGPGSGGAAVDTGAGAGSSDTGSSFAEGMDD